LSRLLHPDLRAVARRVAVTSATAYAIGGEVRDLSAALAATGAGAGDRGRPPDEPPALLLQALESELYSRLYCRLETAAAAGAPGDRRALLGRLSAANCGRGSWEPGWRVVERDDDGRLAVIKDQVTFWVEPDGLRCRGEIVPGAYCRVRVGKELRNLVPGFYVAIGDGDAGDDDRPGPLLRLYWHLAEPAAAVAYVAEATRRLNAAGVPFRTKVVADPGGYLRADAGVLYLERRDYRRLRPEIRAIHRRLATSLRPEVPLFTRPLLPGLGVADDPRDGTSFGQSRCRLVAGGLWLAHRRGATGPAARAGALAEVFAAAGLDPRRPHLEPGSRDVAALAPRRRRSATR